MMINWFKKFFCIFTSIESSCFHQHLVLSYYFLTELALTLGAVFAKGGEPEHPCRVQQFHLLICHSLKTLHMKVVVAATACLKILSHGETLLSELSIQTIK